MPAPRRLPPAIAACPAAPGLLALLACAPWVCSRLSAQSVTPTLSVIHHFTRDTDGGDACASLIQGIDGNFYGTTLDGGLNGYGTLFKLTPTGTLTTLYAFDGDAGQPSYGGSVLQTPDGNLYGIVPEGGLLHVRGSTASLPPGSSRWFTTSRTPTVIRAAASPWLATAISTASPPRAVTGITARFSA